ncbi:MAG: hypothetical protein AAGP08_15335 [Pseudomonadota bacterium]
MDPIALAFYAVVCGCLSAASPKLPSLPVRLAIGAGVGVIAALVLPVLRGVFQAY